ncbi:peroxiredoxin [Sulfolobus sp. E5-1-F]|uniref:DsrE family protein n=1 Tax=Sulfolobaceae TaxID=118883 RepID=UPI001296BE7F|nr:MULTISPECIES: DsrE family protein [unclassified Sulfolobus]QGA55295.1 peroxiredoxin [Sulfolobus sp. E5-1-F]QGA68081.1 peroxiredoxin [Sulfolobus sp. E11-6]
MSDLYAIMVISGEAEKLYMAYITAIGYASSGNKVYMFFTMDGLRGVTKEIEKIQLPNVKPLSYYYENLIELGGDDIELAACEFGMKVKNVDHERLLDKVKVSGVSEFALKSSEAKATLIF